MAGSQEEGRSEGKESHLARRWLSRFWKIHGKVMTIVCPGLRLELLSSASSALWEVSWEDHKKGNQVCDWVLVELWNPHHFSSLVSFIPCCLYCCKHNIKSHRLEKVGGIAWGATLCTAEKGNLSFCSVRLPRPALTEIWEEPGRGAQMWRASMWRQFSWSTEGSW